MLELISCAFHDFTLAKSAQTNHDVFGARLTGRRKFSLHVMPSKLWHVAYAGMLRD